MFDSPLCNPAQGVSEAQGFEERQGRAEVVDSNKTLLKVPKILLLLLLRVARVERYKLTMTKDTYL